MWGLVRAGQPGCPGLLLAGATRVPSPLGSVRRTLSWSSELFLPLGWWVPPLRLWALLCLPEHDPPSPPSHLTKECQRIGRD